ncbi:MAG TPA: UDP-N-acetylmuramoyl-L-alanyl-D-glutamate--2,6-diaminopimelate ligase [Patescibacteria group bacterium]|nr:UDP-N-acetylmuramoyl-L-alanyl-D-glutamate--2,6-diaminopimelate ligase [Patescibacteria group bacterium]
MKLKELIRSLGSYEVYAAQEDFEVKGISASSAHLADGYLFAAIKGVNEDGHRFIDDAIAKGARAVVIDSRQKEKGLQALGASGRQDVWLIGTDQPRKSLGRLAAEFYGNPSRTIRMTGVTGTNGKTTITYLAEAIARKAGFTPGVIGTVDYRFKQERTPSKNTTPGPVDLQSLLARMLAQGVTYCVMEVSSHALDQDRTEGILFNSAIFTNLTQDHLDYHRNLEEYFRAKCRLFAAMPADASAIVNNDDAYGRRIKALTPARVTSYGIENLSDVVATDIKFDVSHTTFFLRSFKGAQEFTVRLIGFHNVYNVLAAVSWGLVEGFDLEVIKSAVEAFLCVPGRLERIETTADFAVFVDYAHTDDALRNVIKTLRYVSPKRIIVVFGCGGQRDATKRPKMGRVVTEYADYAVITNDNPRSESPEGIIEDIKRGIKTDNYCVIPDRREAIRKAISCARSGDIVLVAGKGHEDYQILNEGAIVFDDRQVVRECLRQMRIQDSPEKIDV